LAVPFSKALEGSKSYNITETQEGPNLPQNLHLISLFPKTGKVFNKVTLKIVQKHSEERGLLNRSQFDFCAHHSMTLQCMGLIDHVTLNFNMSMAAVFLILKKSLNNMAPQLAT
jgi:hypothetical protein